MTQLHPTQIEKQVIIDVYHSFPTKEITLDMLKEARKRTCLDLGQCKAVIQEYIQRTYGEHIDVIIKRK